MRRATAINLALLGGGLSLFGAAGVLAEHNRYLACERQRPPLQPGEADPCVSHWGGGGHAGGGGGSAYHSSSSSGGGFFASIARGGFGGFGAAHGGGE